MPFIPDLRRNRWRASCGEIDHTLRKIVKLYCSLGLASRQKTLDEASAKEWSCIYIASRKYEDVEMKETKCRQGEMERVIHSLSPMNAEIHKRGALRT